MQSCDVHPPILRNILPQLFNGASELCCHINLTLFTVKG